MLEKTPDATGATTTVRFSLAADGFELPVYVAGEFNGWAEGQLALHADGPHLRATVGPPWWALRVPLPRRPGRWFNDPEADDLHQRVGRHERGPVHLRLAGSSAGSRVPGRALDHTRGELTSWRPWAMTPLQRSGTAALAEGDRWSSASSSTATSRARRPTTPSSEHTTLMREAEYAIFADKHNWKYAWFGEHHAPHRVQPHVGARGRDGLRRRADRLHPPRRPAIIEPVAAQGAPGPLRRARRDARPLHRAAATSGAPAAAPAATRSPRSTSSTRTRPRPSGTRSSTRSRACGSRSTTRSRASTSRCRRRTTSSRSRTARATRRSGSACGNPPTFAKAGELGIGAIAFNFEPIYNLQGRIDAYKEAIAELHRADRPVQERQRDDDQRGHLPRGPRARPARSRCRTGRGYLVHDGEPVPRHDAEVAGRDHVAERADPARDVGRRRGRSLDQPHRRRLHARAARPTRCASRSSRYQDVGCDQLVFGLPGEGMHHDEILEMLELFGDKVIPEFDTDPMHSTTRYRATAKPRRPGVHRARARHRGPVHPLDGAAPAGPLELGGRRSPSAPPARRIAMPRDATATKTRLLDEAERLPGRGSTRRPRGEITEAAGQRNVSALSYHFGSREGVLRAILARHSPALDDLRLVSWATMRR